MSDQRLRELERSAAAGDVEAEARFLLERIRAGDLLKARVQVAAQLGHRPSRLALPDETHCGHAVGFACTDKGPVGDWVMAAAEKASWFLDYEVRCKACKGRGFYGPTLAIDHEYGCVGCGGAGPELGSGKRLAQAGGELVLRAAVTALRWKQVRDCVQEDPECDGALCAPILRRVRAVERWLANPRSHVLLTELFEALPPGDGVFLPAFVLPAFVALARTVAREGDTCSNSLVRDLFKEAWRAPGQAPLYLVREKIQKALLPWVLGEAHD